MKTIMRAIGTISAVAFTSLLLLAGCQGIESDEDGEVDSQASEEALDGCTYPNASHKGGGTIVSDSGCFPWSGKAVHYISKGAGNMAGGSIGTVTTPAKAGDYEILALSASHGGDTSTEVDTWFDSKRMTDQGFKGIGVRGETDKKIELWVRKSTGKTTIVTPDKAVEYNVLVLKGADISLNLGGILKHRVEGSGEPWNVPVHSGSDFNVLAYFGDDSVEVTDAKGGELIFNQWGFGDGDSLNVMFYAPGTTLPTTIGAKNHDIGGRQYVGILANFPRN